jgi:hypothetical protein
MTAADDGDERKAVRVVGHQRLGTLHPQAVAETPIVAFPTWATLGSTTSLPPPRVIGRGARSAAAAVAAKQCGAKCQSLYPVHTKPPRRASRPFKSMTVQGSLLRPSMLRAYRFQSRHWPPLRPRSPSTSHPSPPGEGVGVWTWYEPLPTPCSGVLNTLPSTTPAPAVVGVPGCSDAESLHQ